VDRAEAGAIADAIVAELRALDYDELARRLLGEIETREVSGASGAEYQVEIQGIRDAGPPRSLMVIVGVDDGSLRGAFSPVDRSFIVSPDGAP
jgi:hypothetical protein